MTGNHLEQLIAEWYEYQGYFVRQNVLVGKRLQGGYDCELDIVGFHPQKPHLVHIEPSLDTDSWIKREARYQKQFQAGRDHIPELFAGFELPEEIEQIAVLLYASKANHQTLGGGRLVLVSEILEDIFRELKHKRLDCDAVPEHLTILRSFQFVTEYRKNLMCVWSEEIKTQSHLRVYYRPASFPSNRPCARLRASADDFVGGLFFEYELGRPRSWIASSPR